MPGAAFGVTAVADASVLYVNSAKGCSDIAFGAGSQTTPFCTINAALSEVGPGQTVDIAEATYTAGLDLTHSGAPGAPITIVGAPGSMVENGSSSGMVLDRVHDVVIKGLIAESSSTAPAVAVEDSSAVTIENAAFYPAGQYPAPGAAIDVSGQSSSVELLRNSIDGYTDGISLDAGVSGTLVADNVVNDVFGTGILASSAPGSEITNNTLTYTCGTGISLTGASTGATVENNIASAANVPYGCTLGSGALEIAVSADSVEGTTADYNMVPAVKGSTPYNWGGTDEPTLAAFQQTGQGAHDLASDPLFVTGAGNGLQEGSPAIDSGDSDAPGALSPDVLGHPRVDDPLVPNSGAGSISYVDRGAYEYQDPFTLNGLSLPTQAPYLQPITATATVATNSWGTPLTYTFDFGDGSTPVISSTPTASHSYGGPSTRSQTYTVTVTATTPFGVSQSQTQSVQINPPAPLKAALSAGFVTDPMGVNADSSGSSDPWAITDRTLDFGDGTAPVHQTYGDISDHTYARPGTYTITLTDTDTQRATAVATEQVTIGQEYEPMTPQRLLDTRSGTGAPKRRVGSGGVVSLTVGKTGGPVVWGPGQVPAGATAVVLNVTVVNPASPGFVTVYPDGTSRPGTSNLNFTARQTVSNLITVPVGADGKVDFFNSSSSTDLVADVQGYYAERGYVLGLSTLVGTAPTQLLDTRTGLGGHNYQGDDLKLRVTGIAGVPADATAVILNVTAVDPNSTGFVTVYPYGNARPVASNLNFAAGRTTANMVVVPVGAGGTISLGNGTKRYNLVAELLGYYTSMDDNTPTPSSQVRPLFTIAPTRFLDTRYATGAPKAKLGAGGVLKLKVAGVHGLPQHVTAVLVNLTAAGPTAAGYLTAYADGSPRPATSTLDFAQGQTVPNLTLVRVGGDGCIDIYNNAGRTDVFADVQGYYVN